MRQHLRASGNGWSLYLPKDVMKLLGYNPQTTNLLLTMNDNILEISKIDEDKINPDFLVKKLNKNGNGYGIYLSNPIIQFLEINPETDKVKYKIKNDILYISKDIE